ncbi:pirin family protein [Inhella sp.]|uniref:pirin family protein n=1 Tax=Inhella sp. TaxID=1921806 RepID=UPI0035B288AC
MSTLFRASQRGGADHGWLQASHSFSFADWYEPSRMGFGVLRVLNDDRVAPHSGFGTHGHRDMEIVTYLLDGALWHKDSMGNGEAGAANAGVIRPGEIQRMSAGSGVMHSEMNRGDTTTHLLQIWLLPRSRGGAPGYEQRQIEPAAVDGRLALLAAPEGGLTYVNSDARLYAGRFDGEQSARQTIPAGRLCYVHLARGRARVQGEWLEAGDAMQFEAEPQDRELHIEQGERAELLVFDLGPAA